MILHDRMPESFEKGAIHLIPVFMVPEISLKADLFISTFALSESSQATQQMIVDKNSLKRPFAIFQANYMGGEIILNLLDTN